MATEPEREIEKMLAAYAEERRNQAGAPFTLHPATRAVLQGEVTRRLAKTGANRSRSTSWLSRWWPRLALVAGLAALAVVVIPHLSPSRTREEGRMASSRTVLAPELSGIAPAPVGSEPLASPASLTPPAAIPPPAAVAAPVNVSPTSTRYRAAPVVVSAPGPASAPASETAVVRNSILSDRAAPVVASAPAPAPVMPATAPAAAKPVPNVPFDGAIREKVPVANSAPVDLAVAPSALARSEGAAAAVTTFGGGKSAAPMSAMPVSRANPLAARFSDPGLPELAQTQQFSQLSILSTAASGRVLSAPAMKTDAAPTGVLNNFRVEQTGDHLRVIDADGSSYTGTIGRRDISPGESARRATAPAAALGGPATAGSATYFFRVEGTNRSLRQLVRFSGEMVPTLSARPAGAAGAPLPGTNAFLQQFQMQGRARIGDTREIQINAVPEGR